MKKIITFLILSTSVTLILSGCNKGLDKINSDNTNFPSEVLPKNELPQLILSTAEVTTGTDLAWYASVYIEHSVGVANQLWSADQRQTINNPSIDNNSWNGIYTSNLITGMDMIKKTKGTNDGHMEAVARIMVAYNLGVVADLWGDAPFSQAFNIQNLRPKYDPASDLYDTVISYLNTAVTLLQLPNQTALPTTEDFLYGGDTTKWRKAAHSLLARYYLRLSNIRPEYYQNALNEIPLGFESADDAMIFTKYTATQGEWNPWYDFVQSRDYLATSNTLYNLMAANDPRKQKMFSIPDGSGCRDNPVPNDLSSAATAKACVAVYSTSGASPMPLMSYHELLFIQAECEARLNTGNALQSLKDAITANFLWNGNTDAEASTYTASITTADIPTILKEKYIAQYPSEALEAYDDYRRTKGDGSITLNNPLNNVSTAGFPNFFPYPISEISSNSANVPQRSVVTSKPIWAK